MELSNVQNKTMSSREIAKLTGKDHKNVVRVIQHAQKEHILTAQNEPLDFIHRGNTYKHYELNKKDSMYVVARLSPEFTMVIIDRWDELENAKPAWLSNLSPQAVIAIEDMNKQIETLADKVALDAPKVKFVSDYVEHGDTHTFTRVAAILGVKLGFLMSTLQAKKVVYKLSGEWQATANYAEHFEVKVGTNTYPDKVTGLQTSKDYSQLRVTSSGLVWMTKRFGRPELNTPVLQVAK